MLKYLVKQYMNVTSVMQLILIQKVDNFYNKIDYLNEYVLVTHDPHHILIYRKQCTVDLHLQFLYITNAKCERQRVCIIEANVSVS